MRIKGNSFTIHKALLNNHQVGKIGVINHQVVKIGLIMKNKNLSKWKSLLNHLYTNNFDLPF